MKYNTEIMEKYKMTKTTLFITALLLLSTAAHAGEISKIGEAIEVEDYRCVVKSERSIECQNIGRVCEAANAKQKKQNDYYFGCGLDKWKAAHPKESCMPPDGKVYRAPSYCDTMRF